MITPPPEIVCVECGGPCGVLSYPPPEDDPWREGDVVAYRCAWCAERFDMVLCADDDPERGEAH